MCVCDDEVIFVIYVEGDLGAVEFLHRHVLKPKRKGVLPDGIVGLLSDLG